MYTCICICIPVPIHNVIYLFNMLITYNVPQLLTFKGNTLHSSEAILIKAILKNW